MNLESQLQLVYAELGCAIGEAQLLEQYLRQLILAAQVQVGSGTFDTEMAVLSKQSLGGLILRFQSVLDVPLWFGQRLEAARLLRNKLAHSYCSEKADAFQTDSGQAEIIAELDRIGSEFYELWGYLDMVIVGWLGRPNPTKAELIEDFTRVMCEA